MRLTLWTAAVWATIAWQAAADVRVPAAADAGRLEQEHTPPPVPESQVGILAGPPVEEQVAAPPGADTIYFVLENIALEGTHRYKADELLPPRGEWRGKKVPLSLVYKIASSVLQRYHRDGYSFVSVVVPPQQITDGIVRIRVIEARVTHVVVEGIAEGDIIKPLEERIMALRPLHAPTLESEMLLLSDLPGVAVKGLIEPDQSGAPGELVLRLIGQHKIADASVTVDNYASRLTGPWEATPMAALNGLLGGYDRTALSAVSSSPYGAAHFYSLSHSEPIDIRTTATVTVTRSESAPGFTLAPEDITSETAGASVSVKHALIRSRAENWSLTGTLDANDLESDILGTKLYRDRIRALRLNSTYDAIDSWGGTDLLSVTAGQGLNVLGARQTGDADLSRSEGRSDFTKLDLTASRLQPLPMKFAAYTLIEGQYSTSALLASEQFGFGGPFIGRGYDPSEIIGDRGIAASQELRYNGLPEWMQTRAQPFVFYDIGTTWDDYSGGTSTSAASAGLGVRAQGPAGLQATAFLAWPLTRTPEAPPSTSHPDAPRIGVSMGYQY
jgi:hemolysin activation/secretion protein